MSTINIEIEVPSSMPWSKKDFVEMVKAYAKALTNVKLKDTKEENAKYEDFVMSLCGEKEDFDTAEKMCKEIRESRTFNKTRKIASFDGK